MICDGCSRPQGLGSITMTDPNYQVYHGVDITATKRYSNNWQMQLALTLQTNPNYFPEGSTTFINPTNREFREGASTIPEYNFKANGSYTFPWDISASANLNIIQGASRTTTINGPGSVYGGVNSSGAATTISYGTGSLEVEERGATRFEPVKLLDLGLQKAFRFGASKYQLKLMFDAFNIFNINTITLVHEQQPQQCGLHRTERDYCAARLSRRHESGVLRNREVRYGRRARGLSPGPFFLSLSAVRPPPPPPLARPRDES